MGRRKRSATKRRTRRRRQKGGILPLAALIPALIAGGKYIGKKVTSQPGENYDIRKTSKKQNLSKFRQLSVILDLLVTNKRWSLSVSLALEQNWSSKVN